MEEYKFSEEVNERIVDGILKGYKSYLTERNQKREELIISSAYAWVKGNHIDHHVAEETKSVGMDYYKSKAGYSWGYLQFKDLNERVLFLIKNGAAIENKKLKRNARRNLIT